MSTQTNENMNFKVVTMGQAEVDNRRKSNFRPLTLERLLGWIDSQQLDEQVKAELKKMASTYPQQALPNWRKNYQKHLSKALVKLKREDVTLLKVEKEESEEQRQKREEYIKRRKVIDSQFDDGVPEDDPGEDRAGSPNVHPNVQDEGCCGSGLNCERPAQRKRGKGAAPDARANFLSRLRDFGSDSDGVGGPNPMSEWDGDEGRSGN